MNTGLGMVNEGIDTSIARTSRQCVADLRPQPNARPQTHGLRHATGERRRELTRSKNATRSEAVATRRKRIRRLHSEDVSVKRKSLHSTNGSGFCREAQRRDKRAARTSGNQKRRRFTRLRLSAGLGVSAMDKTDLSLPIAAPSDKGAREKGVVIGWFPFLCAEGKEFFNAHVRFDDGSLLHYVCDALVYSGDELSIGGRKFPLKKGEEFWIVRFRTEEHPGDRFAQVDTSNVKLRGADRRPSRMPG